jgi:hypothetical protein
MKSHQPTLTCFDTPLDISKRIDLVMSTYKKLGYINRKALVVNYGISQQQAGSLMRDFIHLHAKRIQWDMKHAHYILTD